MAGAKTPAQLETLTADERQFLRLAQQKFRANEDWFEFESFAFGMDSPLFTRSRSHLEVLAHPLYLVLKEMWLDLGRKQGHVATSQEENSKDGSRRQAIRGGPT